MHDATSSLRIFVWRWAGEEARFRAAAGCGSGDCRRGPLRSAGRTSAMEPRRYQRVRSQCHGDHQLRLGEILPEAIQAFGIHPSNAAMSVPHAPVDVGNEWSSRPGWGGLSIVLRELALSQEASAVYDAQALAKVGQRSVEDCLHAASTRGAPSEI